MKSPMTNRRKFLSLMISTPVLAVGVGPAFAKSNVVFNTDGTAIHGTDPVAYFTQGGPVDGLKEHSLMWRGSMWYFASAENMAAFESDPRAYAPQYGGYCAYAMAKGYVATSVPEAWTIHEDKLYLNFSKGVRLIWRRKIPEYIAAADANWPGVLG